MSETELLENYLAGKMNPEEILLMEARLIVRPELREKKYWQQMTYRLVKSYGRKQLKREIKAVENRLFNENEFAGFRQKIASIFS